MFLCLVCFCVELCCMTFHFFQKRLFNLWQTCFLYPKSNSVLNHTAQFFIFWKRKLFNCYASFSLPSQIRSLERKHQPRTYIPMLKYFCLFDICTGSKPTKPYNRIWWLCVGLRTMDHFFVLNRDEQEGVLHRLFIIWPSPIFLL